MEILSVPMPERPDELSLCDAEIRAVFEGKEAYLIGTPTMAQLAKELRLLREALPRFVFDESGNLWVRVAEPL